VYTPCYRQWTDIQ